jgi:undecaprenyl-diphosphatase
VPVYREREASTSLSVLKRRSSVVESFGESRSRVVQAAGALLVTAAVIFVVGVILGLVVVGRHGGGLIQGWDNTVEQWYVHHRGSFVGASKFVATYLDALPLGVASVVLTLILASTLRTTRALVPVVAYLGGEFQVFVIREVILRPRPPTANYPAVGAIPGVHETGYSYPSGHAVAVTAMLFALLGSIALARRIWWPWLIAAVASLFVVDTRLVLGVHWFSDVAFGFLFGVIWGIAVAGVFNRLEWADLWSLPRWCWERLTAEPRSTQAGNGARVGEQAGTALPDHLILDGPFTTRPPADAEHVSNGAQRTAASGDERRHP